MSVIFSSAVWRKRSNAEPVPDRLTQVRTKHGVALQGGVRNHARS
jgi:hypothetical protein